MRILLDNGVPRGLARYLMGHQIEEARARGWEELANGRLIDAAEQAGFDAMITNDKNIRYQQNLTMRKLAILVLGNSQWHMVKRAAVEISAAVDQLKVGSYVEVAVPFQRRGGRST